LDWRRHPAHQADLHQIEQVMMTWLSMLATPCRGRNDHVKTGPITLDESWRRIRRDRAGRYILVSVRDTGLA